MNSKSTLTEHPILHDCPINRPNLWQNGLNALSYFASQLVRCLTAGHEPCIQRIRLRGGQVLWIAYDPVTNTTFRSTSEEDISSWLDRRWHSL